MAIIIWVNASGEGVRIAAAIKITRMAYRLCFANVFELTTPILAMKKIMTGSSKERPKASNSFMASERYSLKEIIGLRMSDENSTKKPNAGGRAKKYPKRTPPINNRDEVITKGITYFFSDL